MRSRESEVVVRRSPTFAGLELNASDKGLPSRTALAYRMSHAHLPLPLARLAHTHPAIEFRGLLARDAQRFPLRMFEVLGEEHDLSAMVGVMRHLAIDGLHH